MEHARPTSRMTPSHRRGIGLLEVILCTGLLAVMMVPIAGVIRASGKSIELGNGGGTVEANMRQSLRWIADAVRDGRLLSAQSRRIKLQLSSGGVVTIEVQGRALVITEGRNATTLIDNVRDVSFELIKQVSPPTKTIGLSVSLRATDRSTRNVVTIDSTVVLPPQI